MSQGKKAIMQFSSYARFMCAQGGVNDVLFDATHDWYWFVYLFLPSYMYAHVYYLCCCTAIHMLTRLTHTHLSPLLFIVHQTYLSIVSIFCIGTESGFGEVVSTPKNAHIHTERWPDHGRTWQPLPRRRRPLRYRGPGI